MKSLDSDRAPLAAFLIAAALPLAALAQTQPHALVGASVITMEPATDPAPDRPAPQVFDPGIIIFHQGKITAVGPASGPGAISLDAVAPEHRLDMKGKTILPGLVDTHSHIGGMGGADNSGPFQPEVRISDSLNPLDAGFRRALAGGLTTLNVMPGSGHLLSGQTAYLKLRNRPDGSAPRTIEDLQIRATFGDPTSAPMGGIKMANGTNPMRDPPFAGTRGKAAAVVRQRLIAAQEFLDKRNRGDDKKDDAKPVEDKPADTQPATDNDTPADTTKPTKAPKRDLALEALAEALEGKKIIHHHTHRADDIMTVLRLQQEFGFRVVLHHTSEAWKVPDQIAQAVKSSNGKVMGCSIILLDSPGGKLEAAEKSWITGGVLEKAGVPTSIHTDDWINDSRLFFRCAAFAVRAGMSEYGALKALTIEGAKQLDLADRVGSIKVGKEADFAVLSGNPLSIYTKVEQTFVEGQKVFDRSDPDDLLHAVGGFGAARDAQPYFCCFGLEAFSFGGQQWMINSGTTTSTETGQ
jgi:imidazolonepropionase-like amidohydrolase